MATKHADGAYACPIDGRSLPDGEPCPDHGIAYSVVNNEERAARKAEYRETAAAERRAKLATVKATAAPRKARGGSRKSSKP